MQSNGITMKDFHEIIGNKGRIFSVVFTKKDGTEREMHCRIGVKKGVKGVQRNMGVKYDNVKGTHKIVYSIQDKAFRTVDITKISKIKANKHVFNL